MRIHTLYTLATVGTIIVMVTLLGSCGSGVTPLPDGNPLTGDPPVASFTIQKSRLTVNADASDIDEACQVRWDWTHDGTWDTEWTTTKTAEYTYDSDGTYTIALEVKNGAGDTDTATKQFKITSTNHRPTAAFACNMVNGMTVSVDASSSSDEEDPVEDLEVRWDWTNDGEWDTDWTTTKTAEYTYTVAAEYTIKLQVRDLNDTDDTEAETVIASPIDIRSSFIVRQSPYMVRINFRVINKLTGNPVAPTDDPPLERHHFKIYEDGTLIDASETNQILTAGSRPMHLVLVLDYTGSMHDAGGIESMVTAAKSFIDSQPETTYLSLWACWERQKGYGEITTFTACDDNGKAQLKTSLDAFTSEQRDQGATEIRDLVAAIIAEKFLPVDNGVSRAIVFLTDGHDTTSTTGVSKLITEAKDKAVALWPVGLAFRPELYPDDEPDLKKLADDTNGTYFTVNQVSDLQTVFEQMAKDLQCDWTLSYMTLIEKTGKHTISVDCDYLDGLANMHGRFPVYNASSEGDIRQGLLAVGFDSESASQTVYTLSANYIPRNIDTIYVRVSEADAPAVLSLYETGSLCTKSDGWTITPDVDAGADPPADGWYTITSDSVLEVGAFGKIAKCTVDAPDLPSVTFDVPSLAEQADLYGDKRIVFEKTADVTIHAPTILADIATAAEHGTPADAGQPSANAGQIITLTGRGLCPGDMLVVMTIDNAGDKAVDVVSPVTVTADATAMEIELPDKICTDTVYLLDDFARGSLLLQIVPYIKNYSSTSGRYTGTGFIEGGITAIVDGTEYPDWGPYEDDGINVSGYNTYFTITTSYDDTQPVYVQTEGGTSNTFDPGG